MRFLLTSQSNVSFTKKASGFSALLSLYIGALALLLGGCDLFSPLFGSDKEYKINPNIVKLKDCCDQPDLYYGELFYGHQQGNRIYYIGDGMGYLQVSESYGVAKDTVIPYEAFLDQIQGKAFTYQSRVTQNLRSLVVRSAYSYQSVGRLYEYDHSTTTFTLLKDSSFHVSSAVYWHGDQDKLVYYSYGNDEGLEAGYYLHDKRTGTDSLLLTDDPAFRSLGPYNQLNGFDLSPDNTTLLVPNVRATYSEGPNTPQVIEYNLVTQQADTFATEFDLSFVRIGLWLRYSPSGDRILYCNFPLGALDGIPNDDSEMGIIELPSRQKQVLDVNTNAYYTKRSVQLAPTWSPNGQHIIYSSGSLTTRGLKMGYDLYLLKNVDNPRNYQ